MLDFGQDILKFFGYFDQIKDYINENSSTLYETKIVENKENS